MKAVHIAASGEVIAIDGKTVRGSYDKKSKKSTIHMVSAFAAGNGVVLGQIKTAEKPNEITVTPQLIDLLDIKGNQRHLHQSIKDFFDICHETNFFNVSHQFHEEIDSGHSRVESLKYWSIENQLH